MERYGEWSSENTGGYWRKGPDGVPGTGQIGDQFVGINRRDGEEWKAPVEIVERDEEGAYAFVTGGREMNLVLWRYELQPDGDGTVLTEQWTMTNPAYFLERGGEEEVVTARRPRQRKHRGHPAGHEDHGRGLLTGFLEQLAGRGTHG